jgi:flagellar L-ring protein FlgH
MRFARRFLQTVSRSRLHCFAYHCRYLLPTLIAGLCSAPATAWGQNSSLLQRPVPETVAPLDGNPRSSTNPLSVTPEGGALITPQSPLSPQLAATSWTYATPPAPRILRVHDVVSIRVDEIARMTADGRANQRKNTLYDLILADWIETEGFKAVRKAPQMQGDPEINAQLSQINRATSNLETRESLAFNIAAEIADIRPNGNIVLEAHKSITINDNRWELSLSGMCQAQDIGPDNLVLSKDIIDLKIDKRESGQARDGYRRGWFVEWASRLQPF